MKNDIIGRELKGLNGGMSRPSCLRELMSCRRAPPRETISLHHTVCASYVLLESELLRSQRFSEPRRLLSTSGNDMRAVSRSLPVETLSLTCPFSRTPSHGAVRFQAARQNLRCTFHVPSFDGNSPGHCSCFGPVHGWEVSINTS